MEKSRFVVEYLAEDGSDVESMFLEAVTEQEAKDLVLAKCGAFSTILSCQLTKTNGGSGKQTKTETVDVVDIQPKAKKEKVVKEPKQPKINNADKIALRVVELKATNGTKAELFDWILVNVTSSESMAKWYVKQLGKELS